MAWLRRWVVATRSWPLLPGLYRALYGAAARMGAAALSRACGPGLKALYLRRGMTGGDWVPGISDLDLLAVVEPEPGGEAAMLRRLWKAHAWSKRWAPMLGELQVASPAGLRAWASWGGARAQEMASWVPLKGSPVSGAPLGPRPPLYAQEALNAGLSLAQLCFETVGRVPVDFGFKALKWYLDVERYSDAAFRDSPPQSRRESRARLDRPQALLLEKPERLDQAGARLLLHCALRRLEALGGPLPPSPGEPRIEWPGDGPPCVDTPLWGRRLGALLTPGLPRAGLYMDTLFRWFVVTDSVPEPGPFLELCALVDRWHREDNAFQAPGLLLTGGMLRLLAQGIFLDTPLFREALGPPGDPWTVWARPHSRRPPWSGHYRLRWGIDPGLLPPETGDGLRAARQAAVEFGLSLGLYGQDGWAGPGPYRLFYLYSRVLSLRLLLEGGTRPDPQDLDALVEEYRRRFPKEDGLGALEAESAAGGGELPSGVFYRHLPFLSAVLEKAAAYRAPER